MIYKNAQGKKLYPVCSWEANQNCLYNAHDRIMNAISDAREAGESTAELYEKLERCENAMFAFNAHVIGGLVYATWEDGQIIKDFVWAYNARH